MPNITMTLEEDVLRKVRRMAVRNDTTLTSLVRDHLRRLAMRETQSTEDVIVRLKESFARSRVIVGPHRWTREDLHAR